MCTTVSNFIICGHNLLLRVVKGGGGLNHESREINKVFHDSRKFYEGFTFHVKSLQDGMIVVLYELQ